MKMSEVDVGVRIFSILGPCTKSVRQQAALLCCGSGAPTCPTHEIVTGGSGLFALTASKLAFRCADGHSFAGTGDSPYGSGPDT